jgi:hypothetical protein
MSGTQLSTFCEELNGGASIGSTLLFQFLNLAKALVEQRRPWMLLRATDSSKSVTAANTWQTAIELSTITRFSRFYGDNPIRLFDGTNRIVEYRQVPFEERLSYKDAPNTFVYDEATKTLYLNGTLSFAGTLYIHHIKDSADVEAETSWSFPSWAHPLLGYMAVAMNKGGVDYDEINARMAPENQQRANQIISMLEKWDNEKQLSARSQVDPLGISEGYRSGAIDMNA